MTARPHALSRVLDPAHQTAEQPATVNRIAGPRAGAAERSTAVLAVVVPARNEAELLPRCLSSVVDAAAVVRRHTTVHVVVVADSCTDATEKAAVSALADIDASIVRCEAGNVGRARQYGVLAARRVRPASAGGLWIAMTDADSVVPRDWLCHHLWAAAGGWDAAAGAIRVDDWSSRSHGTAAALAAHRRWQHDCGAHPVHGANLGVDADALERIGGVPGMALSEDAEIVARLRGAAGSVMWMPGSVVTTSARRSARAAGGFSALLSTLEPTA